MIWALAGAGAALTCLAAGLLFLALRRVMRRAAADMSARLAALEVLVEDVHARPAAMGPEGFADLSTGLKDDLAIMFAYAGSLAAIAREESDRVIARIDALGGAEARPARKAPMAVSSVVVPPEDPVADDAPQPPGLDPLALDELEDDATAAPDAGEDEAAFDPDNLGVPDWAKEDGGDDAAAPDAGEDEAAFDPDNLGVPDWAREDGGDDAAAPDAGEDETAFDTDNLGAPDQATEETGPVDDTPQIIADASPAAAPADLAALSETLLAAQQGVADRLEERLASVAAGIMALSSSTDMAERLDALAASGDTRLALVSALSEEFGAGLASLEAGQTALREALEGVGGGTSVGVAEALSALQARTETLSYAVDAAAGAVDEAAEAAATAVLAATQDRAAEDEARLQALCDRIAGMTGDGDALGALSAQVEGLKTRVADMADLAAQHRDALARLEEAVTPDRLRLALDGAAEQAQTATARRAASRIVDMPPLEAPPRPAKSAAGD